MLKVSSSKNKLNCWPVQMLPSWKLQNYWMNSNSRFSTFLSLFCCCILVATLSLSTGWVVHMPGTLSPSLGLRPAKAPTWENYQGHLWALSHWQGGERINIIAVRENIILENKCYLGKWPLGRWQTATSSRRLGATSSFQTGLSSAGRCDLYMINIRLMQSCLSITFKLN